METISVSKCCGVEARENEMPYTDPLYAYRWVCKACKKQCEVEDVCAECGGTGEVITMEPVYAGEPHMAPIGVQPCYACRGGRDDDYNNQEVDD